MDAAPPSQPSAASYFAPPGITRSGQDAKHYDVFISSAGDCEEARETCRRLAQQVFGPMMRGYEGRPTLVPVMWEDSVPQMLDGETITEHFVRVAQGSHASVVLFETRLGEGTKAEVEALLQIPREQRIPLSVVVFQPPSGTKRDSELEEFLKTIRQRVIYVSTHAIGSERAALDLAKVFGGFAFGAMDKHRASLAEARGDDVY